TTPIDGSTVQVSTIAAAGSAHDDLSGIASVTCNGAAAAVAGDAIGCNVSLARGANAIAASATDRAGNTTSVALSVSYARVPVIRITSPANLSYLNISPTTVTGTVDDASAVVTVNSIPVATANGMFTLALPLAEGPNVVTASATSPEGAAGTASIDVTLDTTPPHVTITSPPDQFITTESTISVSGNVNDIVVGTVNDLQAQVTVNGAPAVVANRTFLASNVPLTD